MDIIIGSRGSKLALAQSEEVKARIEALDQKYHVTIKVISTKGDQILDKPLNQIGDKGLFTKEIEEQLMDGRIDLAVHSMKDMPSTLKEGLMFAGTLTPSDSRDCLVFNHGYKHINDLPKGAVVGTGSPRRKSQLLKLRPDLKIVGIRGNVQTRLKKMKEENMDAIVLACAGLKRLGLDDLIGYAFSVEEMIPACCQGVLALEVKTGSPILEVIEKIEDKEANERLKMERLYLQTIGGTCHEPIGCHIKNEGKGYAFSALFGNEDGSFIVTNHEYIETNIENRIMEIGKALKAEVTSHG